MLKSSKTTGKIPHLPKRSQGFTIIEVMIVLAIAALILLIVLLAVPALQRNSRNTAIKSDAAAIIGGVSEFRANNSGQLPSGLHSSYDNNGTITLNSATGTATKVKIQKSDQVYIRFIDGNTTTSHAVAGKLWITFQTKCPDTYSGSSVAPEKSYKSASVVYAIETNSTLLAKCVDG